MKFIGFDREEEAEKWARERMSAQIEPGFFRAVSCVDTDDKFVAVAVFTNFTSRNIDLNFAAAEGNWAKPKGSVEMFNGMFSYVFDTLKAVRVTALINSNNKESEDLVKHIGFKLEGVMRKSFDDGDLHIYGFLNEEYQSHAWRRG